MRWRWSKSLSARLVAAEEVWVSGVLAEPAATSDPVSMDLLKEYAMFAEMLRDIRLVRVTRRAL